MPNMSHKVPTIKEIPCRCYLAENPNEYVEQIAQTPVGVVSFDQDFGWHNLRNYDNAAWGRMMVLSDGTKLVVGSLTPPRKNDREVRVFISETITNAIEKVAENGLFRVRYKKRLLNAKQNTWTTDVAFLRPKENKGYIADPPQDPTPQFNGNVELSPGQQKAVDQVNEWLINPNGNWFFKLNGGAGTGKTTIAKRLAQGRSAMFAAFTGKAVKVLESSGIENVGTIHALLSRPVKQDDPEAPPIFEFWPRDYMGITATETAPSGSLIETMKIKNGEMQGELIVRFEHNHEGPYLLIVDEHSMIGEDTGDWIKRWSEITGGRVLLLGDDNQLEPVGAKGFFVRNRPHVVLTEIHRQQEGSPILQAAQDVLDGKGVVDHGPLFIDPETGRDPIVDYDMTIVSTNPIRRKVNQRYRRALGIPEDDFMPIPGEPIQARANGDIVRNGEIVKCNGESAIMSLYKDRMILMVDVKNDENQKFTMTGSFDTDGMCGKSMGFAYAITCYKAQGSQGKNVYINVDWLHDATDAGRFMYTAITRAKKSIHMNVRMFVPAPKPIDYLD